MTQLTALNALRTDFFAKSHNLNLNHTFPTPEPLSCSERVPYWIGHKALTVVTFPANAVAMALGVAGIATISLPIASLKVAMFTATFGRLEPTLPTGCIWFAQRSISAGTELLRNLVELTCDAGFLAIDVARKGQSVTTALKLDGLFTQMKEVLLALTNKVFRGIDLALQDEIIPEEPQNVSHKVEDLPALCYRSSYHAPDRTLETWFEHKKLCLIALPQLGASALVHSAACFCGMTAIGAKVAIFTVTGKHISTPTDVFGHAKTATYAIVNMVKIGSQLTADLASAIYSVAKATGLARAVATARDVILYIPYAVLS